MSVDKTLRNAQMNALKKHNLCSGNSHSLAYLSEMTDHIHKYFVVIETTKYFILYGASQVQPEVNCVQGP